jgi:hypothetical protein
VTTLANFSLTSGDWLAIVGIAVAQAGAVIACVWKMSGWMSRIEVKIDEVIKKRLDDHDDVLKSHDGRIRDLETK